MNCIFKSVLLEIICSDIFFLISAFFSLFLLSPVFYFLRLCVWGGGGWGYLITGLSANLRSIPLTICRGNSFHPIKPSRKSFFFEDPPSTRLQAWKWKLGPWLITQSLPPLAYPSHFYISTLSLRAEASARLFSVLTLASNLADNGIPREGHQVQRHAIADCHVGHSPGQRFSSGDLY